MVRVSEMRRNRGLPAFCTAVELMVHLSIPEKQDPSGVAGSFHGMCDHKNGLPCGIDLTEQVQQIV